MAATGNSAGRSVAFQGDLGAYSHLACREALPDYEPMPFETFEPALLAVKEGRAARGMIPIENSLAGRVADIHHLLPSSGLYMIDEHFQRVNHHLVAPKSASLETIREVHSHIHALPQCRNLIRDLGVKPVVHADTAGACRMVAEKNDPSLAALGSELAAEIYDLQVLRENVQDVAVNITRFIILSRERVVPHPDDTECMTSFIFAVRSVPAALYKALGGFATNTINITKLESYMEGGTFEQAQFYADIEGHPESRPVALAFEELRFFCTRFEILGTYPKNPFRAEAKKNG